METDVAVLGGGSAGLAAAREARRRQARAVIVNQGPLGGDCTFTGCVPSKTLIESARAGLDFEAAMDRVHQTVARIARTETSEELAAEGIEVIDGEGSLIVDGRSRGVEVNGRMIVARKGVVLATGSRPFRPPIPGLAQTRHLTTDELWGLDRRPSSMAIIGAGAIGCELSQALANLGVEVVVVEMASRVLEGQDPAASEAVANALVRSGVELRLGAEVAAVGQRSGARSGVILEVNGSAAIEAEEVLVATGRSPATDRGGLVEAGITLDQRGHIDNDDRLSTSVSRVKVAGDAAGRVALTHAADHMGRLAAANLLSPWARVRPQRFDQQLIPRVTYTDPEVASIGLSESEAARVDGAMVAELPLVGHDRALAADATDGFIKLIAGPRPGLGMFGGGRILGATIVAERAGEMIAELALAMRVGAFTGRLAQTVHPYPSWSYGIAKAAAQFFVEIEGRSARPARG